MVYMHSNEYIKQRKSGNVEKRPDGRYYLLADGREFTVDDGCPAAGIHDERPARKQETLVPYVDPTGAGT